MVVFVHKRLLVMIVCLAFYQYTTFAQSITELQNKPHIGDKIERQVIEGIYCGKKETIFYGISPIVRSKKKTLPYGFLPILWDFIVLKQDCKATIFYQEIAF